ncbi:BolA protein [Rhodoligotrophos appendicifer]|uniref:BolA family protein n=1 Tax=Rhodoligotrophos appendicifer TaxID=987056 RepID=UPI00117F1C02|nr:BolA family protein [Rhodoligotrophos appendicifer]
MTATGRVAASIREKLTREFGPNQLEILDESDLHAGHQGHRPGGETHFRVSIVSDAFVGKRPIERHRMVNRALSEELRDRVHALAITARVPGEE